MTSGPRIELTPQQLAALDTLRWMVSDNHRRSGRSFVLALAIIQEVLTGEPHWVRVVDHAVVSQRDIESSILTCLKDLAAMGGLQLQVERRSGIAVRRSNDTVTPEQEEFFFTGLGQQSDLMPLRVLPPNSLWELLVEDHDHEVDSLRGAVRTSRPKRDRVP